MLESVEGLEQGPVLEDADGRGTHGAVGELGFSTGGRSAPEVVPDPELAEKASRRRFTAKYKLSIVREADGCQAPGEIGALLRREGLYSSHLGKWRAQRDAGALGGLEPKPRGPRPASGDAVEVARLRGELDRSRSDLATARRVIEVQGNVYALLQELLAKSAIQIDDGTRQR
ncbi:MAG: transposase [Solirubrobacteraceae bacterium]